MYLKINCIFSLLDVDNVLMRMTIVGVLLSFHALCQEALQDVSTTQTSLFKGSVKVVAEEYLE